MAEDESRARKTGAAAGDTATAREVSGGFAGCLLGTPATMSDYERLDRPPAHWPTEILDDRESGRIVCIAGWPYDTLQQGESVTSSVIARRLAAIDMDAGALSSLDLRGRYALAIVCRRSHTVLLATDRMGSIPLSFSTRDGNVAFATAIDSLKSKAVMGSEHDELSLQALYDYVYFHVIPAPSAIYLEMSKLHAAECCLIGADGTIERRRHWEPMFVERSTPSTADIHKEIRETLRRAVARSVEGAGSVGAFLSGGLDSSTVVGMLSEQMDSGCRAFAIGFDAEGYDEMPYARITAEHFGIDLVERYVTPEDVLEALPKIATAFDEPFGNSSALPAYFCARAAREAGVDTLLAGDGGDELFAGNERYVKQRIFERYRSLPGPLRGVVSTLARGLPEWVPLSSKARSFCEQAAMAIPERLQRYNFLHRIAPSEVFTRDFLASVDEDAPLRRWTAEYDAAPDGTSSINRMLRLDWQYTLADNDLRKVTRACDLSGVGVRFPMLDDELVDLSVRIPSSIKLENGQLRGCFKAAMRGWLPDATIDKKKHGFGLPFGVWMRDHPGLNELATLAIRRLRERRIFNGAFLDDLLEMHGRDHAAYYGELVWILISLESWLAGQE